MQRYFLMEDDQKNQNGDDQKDSKWKTTKKFKMEDNQKNQIGRTNKNEMEGNQKYSK